MEVATFPSPPSLASPNKASFPSAPLHHCHAEVASFFTLFDDLRTTESKANCTLEDFQFNAYQQPETTPLSSEIDHCCFMSFADEVFHSGQLLPLPPRLQTVSSGKRSQQSSRATSPAMLSSSMLKCPFQRFSSRNNDFDPFMVALEKVRRREETTRRRSRSLSPLRSSNWLGKEEMKSLESTPASIPLNSEQPTQSSNVSSTKTAQREGSSRKGSRRKGIKKFFLRREDANDNKLTEQVAVTSGEIKKRSINGPHGQGLLICFGLRW